jgi:type II secretory pathway predicted ATPase ExeA/cell division septation protein DedD
MSQWKGYGPDSAPRTEVDQADVTAAQSAASGVLTYEPHFGLKAKPFSLSTDPRALFRGSSHVVVLDELLAAIRRREGLIVLTGEMGTGKTMLCRAALYQLDKKTFTTFVPDPYLTREDLLRMLLVGFGEVSVNDLKQGRLKGSPRADLACQLYEFLTSLESVDAFAALVIDEAQNLSAPLIDEIRALSEMEAAGRRVLQIVLVGQPELQSRLKRPEMRQIAERVTTTCEIRSLSREDVGGYVSHRLAVAGGTRDRVQFSSLALDLVFAASAGIPRQVNRICDRALAHAGLDLATQVGGMHVGRALQELELALPGPKPSLEELPTPTPAAPVVPPAPTSSGGLFVKTTNAVAASSGVDLAALLELPAVSRQISAPFTSSRAEQPASTTWRVPRRRSSWWKRILKPLSLPALGMGVMLLAGGAAVSTVGKRTVSAEIPPLPSSPLPFPEPGSLPPVTPSESVAAALAASANASPVGAMSEQTWVVQVAAFANPSRSAAMVQELTENGWPAYLVEPDNPTDGLIVVRVGPYRSSAEADDVRARLRTRPDYEGAFVRHLTAK